MNSFFKKYLDTFILFSSLSLLIMWVDQFVYKGIDLKDSYFFLMFALSGFLLYVYRRGQKKIEKTEKENEEKKKPAIKASLGSKKKK